MSAKTVGTPRYGVNGRGFPNAAWNITANRKCPYSTYKLYLDKLGLRRNETYRVTRSVPSYAELLTLL